MKLTIIAILSAFWLSSFAQMRKHSISTELGGSNLMCGLLYEHALTPKLPIYGFLGLGVYGREKQQWTFPIGLRGIIPIVPKKTLAAEITASMTYSKADPKFYFIIEPIPNYTQRNFWNGFTGVGLRYTSKRGFITRANVGGAINHWGFIPLISLGTGYTW